MNSIVNMIEKYKLINRVPKDKRSELKMIMDRTNFYEAKDTGNEQYVLNVVEQEKVVDKVDTEGHLYLMCATSRFEIKMLTYEMRFGEKNEVIVLKSADDDLTDAEELAWDRYIAEFCTAIKSQLQYQVEYSVRYVENKAKEVVVTNSQVVKEKEKEQVQNIKVSEEAVKVDRTIEVNPLEAIRKAIEGKSGDVLTLTAYAKDGKFGIGVDLGTTTVANLIIEDRVNLQEEDVLRAITSVVALSQAIGAYIKLKSVKKDVSYYFYHDREVYVPIPEPFVVINSEDLALASN